MCMKRYTNSKILNFPVAFNQFSGAFIYLPSYGRVRVAKSRPWGSSGLNAWALCSLTPAQQRKRSVLCAN